MEADNIRKHMEAHRTDVIILFSSDMLVSRNTNLAIYSKSLDSL